MEEKKYTLEEMERSFGEGFYLCVKRYEAILKDKTDLQFHFNANSFEDMIYIIDTSNELNKEYGKG